MKRHVSNDFAKQLLLPEIHIFVQENTGLNCYSLTENHNNADWEKARVFHLEIEAEDGSVDEKYLVISDFNVDSSVDSLNERDWIKYMKGRYGEEYTRRLRIHIQCLKEEIAVCAKDKINLLVQKLIQELEKLDELLKN